MQGGWVGIEHYSTIGCMPESFVSPCGYLKVSGTCVCGVNCIGRPGTATWAGGSRTRLVCLFSFFHSARRLLAGWLAGWPELAAPNWLAHHHRQPPTTALVKSLATHTSSFSSNHLFLLQVTTIHARHVSHHHCTRQNLVQTCIETALVFFL